MQLEHTRPPTSDTFILRPRSAIPCQHLFNPKSHFPFALPRVTRPRVPQRYPVFDASNDLHALAEIVEMLGSNEVWPTFACIFVLRVFA